MVSKPEGLIKKVQVRKKRHTEPLNSATLSEAATGGVLLKKVFFEISQNLSPF